MRWKIGNAPSPQLPIGAKAAPEVELRSIDGQTALLVYYRGTLQKGSNLPVEFVSAIIVSGKTFTKVSAWCVEPLFHDLQPAFEKLLSSYHSTSGQTTATASPL